MTSCSLTMYRTNHLRNSTFNPLNSALTDLSSYFIRIKVGVKFEFNHLSSLRRIWIIAVAVALADFAVTTMNHYF